MRLASRLNLTLVPPAQPKTPGHLPTSEALLGVATEDGAERGRSWAGLGVGCRGNSAWGRGGELPVLGVCKCGLGLGGVILGGIWRSLEHRY